MNSLFDLIWGTLCVALVAQYVLVFNGLDLGIFKTKKHMLANLIPFYWVIYCGKFFTSFYHNLIEKYKKLK